MNKWIWRNKDLNYLLKIYKFSQKSISTFMIVIILGQAFRKARKIWKKVQEILQLYSQKFWKLFDFVYWINYKYLLVCWSKNHLLIGFLFFLLGILVIYKSLHLLDVNYSWLVRSLLVYSNKSISDIYFSLSVKYLADSYWICN